VSYCAHTIEQTIQMQKIHTSATSANGTLTIHQFHLMTLASLKIKNTLAKIETAQNTNDSQSIPAKFINPPKKIFRRYSIPFCCMLSQQLLFRYL